MLVNGNVGGKTIYGVLQHPLILELEVVLGVDARVAPLARDDNLLAIGELVASTVEGLLDDRRPGWSPSRERKG